MSILKDEIIMTDNVKFGDINNAFKAGTWYVVSSVAIKAVGIITTPIFSRMLTTSEYGIVNTFTAWQSMLQPLFTLELTFSVGRAKTDFPGKLDEYMGSIQLLSFACSVFFAIIGFFNLDLLANLLGAGKLEATLLIIVLIFQPAILFFQNSCKYRYKYKQNILITIIITLGAVIISLLLMLIRKKDFVLCRIIGIIAPIIFLSIFIWIYNIKRGILRYNKSYWKYGLLLSIPLIFNSVSAYILSVSDRAFITSMCGTDNTGIYGLTYSYAVLLTVITSAIIEGWLPWFHDMYFQEKYKEISNNSIPIAIFGCFLGLGTISIAPEAILLLGGYKYINGVYCVLPIVIGILCQFLYNFYVNIELHLKKTHFVAIGSAGAAITNVVLNFIFIPKFGYVAAAYTTLVSYFLLLIGHFLITRFVFHIKLYNTVFMFGSLLLSFAVGLLLVYLYNYNLIRYICIFAGFCSFLYFCKRFNLYRLLKRHN